jgi:Reverse transcriptase (RNA-dependent DNA polymerase)
MVTQDQGGAQGSPSEDSSSSFHWNQYPILIGIANVPVEDRARFWSQDTLGELFDCVAMKPVLTRLIEEDESEEPTAWKTLMELLWMYMDEHLDALMTTDEKHLFVEDSKGLTVLIGHPAMGDPGAHRPRNFGTTLTNFIINFQSYPPQVLARRPITILFEHRSVTRAIQGTNRLDGGHAYNSPFWDQPHVSPLMMDAPGDATRVSDPLLAPTPMNSPQDHVVFETVSTLGMGNEPPAQIGSRVSVNQSSHGQGAVAHQGVRGQGAVGTTQAVRGQGAMGTQATQGQGAMGGHQGIGGQGAVDRDHGTPGQGAFGEIRGVGGQGAVAPNLATGGQGATGAPQGTGGHVSAGVTQAAGGQGATGGNQGIPGQGNGNPNGAPTLAARWHQYGVRVRSAVDTVREQVARTPVFQPHRLAGGGNRGQAARRIPFQVAPRTPMPRIYSNVNNLEESLDDPHERDDLSEGDRYVPAPPGYAPAGYRGPQERPKQHVFRIDCRVPAGPNDTYGSQVFLPEGKTYTLRLRWDQEKSLKTTLPMFGATTTALEWYEAVTTRLMSIGIFVPMYATLSMRNKMGTMWTQLCEAHPEYATHQEAWSSTIAQLLQQAKEKNLITHKAAAGGKLTEILDTHGDDGYAALYDIMSYHAMQLNPPMAPRIVLDQIPRFGDAPSVQVYVRRFKEYFVQLYYRSGQIQYAPELFNSFIMRLPAKVGAVFRSKVWTVDIQDRELNEWAVSMVPKRLRFETIAEAVEDECRMSSVSVDEEIKAKRRHQAASVHSSSAVMAGGDEIDQHIHMIQSARGTAAAVPCKYCHRLWPHEIHMCPRIVEALTIADFVKNKPDLIQKVRATHGDTLEHLLAIQVKERQERNASGNRAGGRANISETSDTVAVASSAAQLTGDANEEFVATALSNDSSSVDQVSEVYFPHDSSVASCSNMDPLHGLRLAQPVPPDELPPDDTDWLPTTGLECFLPADVGDTPWFDLSEDPTVHKVPPSCLSSIDSATAASKFPWPLDECGAHAHMDQGANISAVAMKDYLFCFRDDIPTRFIGDIGGRCHATEGGGYLLMPVSTHQQFLWVPAYYCPALVNNIISPQALRRAYHMRYCTSGMGDDDTGGISLEHRTSRTDDVYIPGIAIHAQLWNCLPAIRPTETQHRSPLPSLSEFISRRGLLPESGTSLATTRDTLKVQHTESCAQCVLLDPSPDACEDPLSKSGEDTLVSPTTHDQPAFIATADSDYSSPQTPDTPTDRAILRMLWHQRLGHMASRRLKNLHKSVKGIPSNLPLGDEIGHCPVCLDCKMRRVEAPSSAPHTATLPYEVLSIDFGFVVQRPDATKYSIGEDHDGPLRPGTAPLPTDDFAKLTPWQRYQYLRGVSGEVAYVTVVDHFSGALFGQTCTSKNPPIEWLEWFLSRHPCDSPRKVVRMDQGGDLGGSRKVHAIFKKHGYSVQPTAPDAPHQNGKIERINQDIGNALRTLLSGANLVPSLWPYAFHHFVRLYNFQPHRRDNDPDADQRTPYEILTGSMPDLSKLRTFGCRVYVRPPGGRKRKTAGNTRKGQFLGYKSTSKNVLYIDDRTREIKEAFHVRFDEAFNDLAEPPPNAVSLRAVAAGHNVRVSEETDDIPPGPHLNLEICPTPFMKPLSLSVPVSCNNSALGFIIKHDPNRDRGYIAGITPRSSASKIPMAKNKFVGAFVVSIDGKSVQHADDIVAALEAARADQNVETVTVIVSPDPYESPDKSLGAIHLDSEQLAAIHAVRSATDRESFSAALRGFRSAFDNGFSSALDSIHSLGTTALGTAEEQALSRFTRARLKKLATWEDWRAGEHKQLDNMAAQGMYGEPVPPPDDAIILRSHWTYSIKADGTRKARNCCDGSERAAPELHGEAKTYASCVEHPCMRIFFALSAVLGMTTFGADATNAFANSPPPAVPTFVRIDDAYADWYKAKYGIDLDRAMVLPVLHALQGHPESGSLWEQTINKILLDMGFRNTTHEPNLYCGLFDGAQVLLCRQVDDLAISCIDHATADRVIQAISKHVSLTTQGVLTRFNGVDIEQTRHFVKLSCESYINNMAKIHAWHTPAFGEQTRPSEPLPPRLYETLQTTPGFAEGTAEHRLLETKFGFSYRSLLGELVYAYVVCRLDIGFAITHLSKYSTRPAEVHFQALVEVGLYLRRTSTWGLMYWRQQPCLSLPDVPFVPVEPSPEASAFPECTDGQQLIAFADAAHGTDINTRRSVSGISCMMGGAAVVFKSKTQSIAATSSTEAEFICAVHTGKIVKYLRSILFELGFEQREPTPIYEDNRAAIDMVNANKPTERSRHIDIQHFAIQGWKQRKILVLKHLSGIVSPSDALTKPLSWVLHSRHTRRLMGHYGPPAYAARCHASS